MRLGPCAIVIPDSVFSLSDGGVRVKMHGLGSATLPEGFVLGKVRPVRDLVSRTWLEGLEEGSSYDGIALEGSQNGWKVCEVAQEDDLGSRVVVLDGFGAVLSADRLCLNSCVLVNGVMQYLIPRDENLNGDEREHRWMDRRSCIPFISLSGGGRIIKRISKEIPQQK